jgi:hypothetical protein
LEGQALQSLQQNWSFGGGLLDEISRKKEGFSPAGGGEERGGMTKTPPSQQKSQSESNCFEKEKENTKDSFKNLEGKNVSKTIQ